MSNSYIECLLKYNTPHIYTSKGRFLPYLDPLWPDKNGDYWVKCDPADYCQSLEQFLKEGRKLHEGDLILTVYRNVFSVGANNQGVDEINTPNINDSDTFILKAKEQI